VQEKRCVVAARYHDVQAVYANHQTFSSVKPPQSQMESVDYFNGTTDMAFSDEPVHGRLRAVLQPVFTVSAARHLEEDIRRLVEDLLDQVDHGDGSMEVMHDLARPLSARVLLGLLLKTPPGDFAIFERLAASMHLLAGTLPGGERPQEYLEAWDAARAYCLQAVERDRIGSADDVLDRVLAARDKGVISGDELFGMLFTLYLGGLSTTATQIGNALVQLMSRPDQYRILCDDRTRVAGAVEECLRYDSAGLFNYRFVREDIKWAGLDLPAGTTIYIVQQACGFDPTVVEDPLRFDVNRPARHLVFGFGIHTCIGAPIARVAVRAVLASMTERYPSLRFAPGALPIDYGGMAQERAAQRVDLITR
jgi:cytochrome P450